MAMEDGEVQLDFRALAEAGVQAARAFIEAGLESGDRVGIWAPNIHEWVVAAIGLQSAGGVLVTLNTRMKGPEAAYIPRNSRARRPRRGGVPRVLSVAGPRVPIGRAGISSSAVPGSTTFLCP